MKNIKVTCVGVCVSCSLLFLSGCSSSFNSRREFAIKNNETFGHSKVGIPEYLYQKVQVALSTVSSKTLVAPHIATAILVKRRDGNSELAVSWIEDYPSVDGAEIRINEQDTVWFVSVPEFYLKKNQNDAKKTILFYFIDLLKFDSDVWRKLEQSNNTQGLMLRLFHGKTPVTDWVPVKGFRGVTH